MLNDKSDDTSEVGKNQNILLNGMHLSQLQRKRTLTKSISRLIYFTKNQRGQLDISVSLRCEQNTQYLIIPVLYVFLDILKYLCSDKT